MSTSPSRALSVRYDGLRRTFAAGHDVVVGRDLHADIRVAHPLISRVHLLLRFDQGRWLAIDNSSMNGTFVNNRRLPVIDIRDGQTINIGDPDGPSLAFEIGRDMEVAGRPPRTAPSPIVAPHDEEAVPTDPQPARWTRGPRPGQSAPLPPRPDPPAHPPAPTQPAPPPNSRPPMPAQVWNLATKKVRAFRRRAVEPERQPGSATIGRADNNDIVVPDVMASRMHAVLAQTSVGTEIRDNHSVNGTFVNGTRVGSAVLSEGDVVTIGNSALVFRDGTLARQAEAAPGTGG